MISPRIKWILALGLFFCLLLMTNLADRSSIHWMSSSVDTIYADRLVAQGLVYDMRSVLATKQVALAAGDHDRLLDASGDDAEKIDALIATFETTKLTSREADTFQRLKGHFDQLHTLERQLADQEPPPPPASIAALGTLHASLVHDLSDLAAIQLEEGRGARGIAARAKRSMDLLTAIEIVLLLADLVLIVMLIVLWPQDD